jgi:hypothetical protein
MAKESSMFLFREHRRLIRIVFLLLFVVALAGPWFYEDDGVPPPEYCDERFVLVAEDRCATLVSGITVMAWLPLATAGVLRMLLTGDLQSWTVIPYILTLTALAVPFLSNLRLLMRGGALPVLRSSRTVVAVATLLGVTWPILLSYADRPLTFPLFWGIWLYMAAALLALAFELLLARRSPPSEAPQTVLPAME